MELVQVRWWRRQVRLLRLEGFSNFADCRQDPQTRVQIGFLQSCGGEKEKLNLTYLFYTVSWACVCAVYSLTFVLYVPSHCFGIHHHGWDGVGKDVWCIFHCVSKPQILRVIHFPLSHQQDPISPSCYARCPGNQHLRLNVCHGNSALVDVFLDSLLRSI